MSSNSEKILTFSRLPAPVTSRLPKWSNLDDIWLKDLAEGMREYLEKQKGSARPAPTPPAKGRLPKWSELDDIWGDALIEACEEFIAERDRRAALAVAGNVGGGP